MIMTYKILNILQHKRLWSLRFDDTADIKKQCSLSVILKTRFPAHAVLL